MEDQHSQENFQKLTARIDQLQQNLVHIHKGIVQVLSSLEPLLQGGMNHDAQQLKQTLNLIARGMPRSRPRIRCIFLVHHITVWDALVGVYEAMHDAADFDPIVITLPHCFTDDHKTYVNEEEAHAGMEKAGIPHLRFDMTNSFDGLAILKSLEPDIIFRQSPWEQDVPAAFTTSEINFARLCYISYGYQTIQRSDIGSYLDADQAYHRACWRIFCLSEKNLALITNNSLLHGRNAILTGYPKFDRLLATGNARSYWPIERGGRSFRVIWGAHHSVRPEWEGFGMFPRVHHEMLEWARANPDVEIVFKPHPMLFESCAHGTMPREQLDAFKAEWDALPNTAFSQGGDHGPLFAASDAMIGDGIGFFSEYQLFDKPLVFLDSQNHSAFNPAGHVLLQGMYRATTAAEATSFLEKFRKDGIDTLKEQRHAVFREIMPFPGESVARILDEIRKGLAEERAENS